MSLASEDRPENLKRGVYVAPYLVHGLAVLIAIDSTGQARKHLKLRPHFSEHEAADWLRAFLDRIDPFPRLALATGTDQPSRSIPLKLAAAGDPYGLEDFAPKRLRLV